MVDELVLHIGPAKTGTTTIQSSLAASSPALRELGVLVPLTQGGSPGQHLPILNELMDRSDYEENFGYSHDVLSLRSVLADADRWDCRRLVVSAEEFTDCPDDVLRLLQAIRPARVVVLLAIRPAVPWCLSLFAQHVAYGLSKMSTWSIERFVPWFVDVFLPGPLRAVDLWRSGPWDLKLRTMFLPHGADHDLMAGFSELAGLPAPAAQERPRNRRLTTCELHLLQSLNLPEFRTDSSMIEQAHVRERVLEALDRDGVPAHDCDCARPLPDSLTSLLERSFDQVVEVVVTESAITIGSVEETRRSCDPADTNYPRFPDQASTARAAVVLHEALRAAVGTEAAVLEARDFWHAQAIAFEEARDYWHGKAQQQATEPSG
jgi:hypothetical protein